VLHDSKFLNITYAVIDISDIETNTQLSYRRQRRLINRRFKKEKKKFISKLLALDSFRANPLETPLELFPMFKKFEVIEERDKFLLAAARIRAQIGQRNRIVKGMFYGGRYFSRMMEIFDQQGVPKELTRLTLVESAFDLSARSKVGASGVWQFMRSTGKRFLRINKAVDERNDPILATVAAAKLLRKNYEALQSWPLAVTAYNHGREGMRRAAREIGSKSLPDIIDSYKNPTFGFASSNFYASFLAILELERDYRKYFGKLMVDSPIEMEVIALPAAYRLNEIVSACELETEDVKELNPAFTRWVTSGKAKVPKGYELRIPPGFQSKCRSGLTPPEPVTPES